MIAAELLSSMWVALLAGAVVAAPHGSTAECVPGACDPLCVDVGRYAVTREIVEDRVEDHRLWQRLVSVRLSQPEAARYCAGLSLEGISGWRLPTPKELQSIRHKPGGLFGGGSSRHYCVPSIDQAAFPETPADLFWTSRVDSGDTAWYVGFDDGRTHRDVSSDSLWVRCTHDPSPGAP
jgi:hypothetical protein